ncbi:MAG: glycosyltransferase [Acidobacteriaceae bacterium]|nr:glycosyltransferase [Acidobacteriaceae bacterium]
MSSLPTGHPVIGYYGAISDWFDSGLVGWLARARPDWEFVLIGSTFGCDLRPLRDVTNVHLLGEKAYTELPGYLRKFDVAIIPFKKLPLTEATNPVKLFEYATAGKPIVATDLTEIRHYDDYVTLATNEKTWLAAVERALDPMTESDRIKLVDFGRRNCWEDRLAQIEGLVAPLFPLVSILIVTYNNLDYTRLCLKSILDKTSYPNYEIIVVDNASTDGTPEFLESFGRAHDHVRVVLNQHNYGFAKGNNIGLAEAAGEYIVFLNNDTVVTHGWLSRLTRYLSDPAVGMIGPVTNSSGNESRIEVDYNDINDMDRFAAAYTRHNDGVTFDIHMLALFCAALRKSTLEEVGLLDERFGIGMFEDDDYAMRIRQRGYRVICAEDVFIHHWGSASFSRLNEDLYRKLFEENRRKFEEKWAISWQPHRARATHDPVAP